MTNQDKIEYLKMAEESFREKPLPKLHNKHGLCLFFSECDLTSEEKEEILGNKYDKINFSFCNGEGQQVIYQKERKELYFERADWCVEQIKRLEMK